MEQRLELALLGSMLSMVLAMNLVQACSCSYPGTPTQAAARADAVFSGRVANIFGPYVESSSADPVRVQFEVSKVWKGNVSTEVTVVTALSSVSCGYEFEKGKVYIVYAYVDDSDFVSHDKGELITSVCTRTKPLSESEQDLTALGNGYAPANIKEITLVDPPSSVIIIILFATVALAAVYCQSRLINKKGKGKSQTKKK